MWTTSAWSDRLAVTDGGQLPGDAVKVLAVVVMTLAAAALVLFVWLQATGSINAML